MNRYQNELQFAQNVTMCICVKPPHQAIYHLDRSSAIIKCISKLHSADFDAFPLEMASALIASISIVDV